MSEVEERLQEPEVMEDQCETVSSGHNRTAAPRVTILQQPTSRLEIKAKDSSSPY